MTTVTASKWVRVNRRNPCPVCGKPDWCLISRDGKAAICARIESEKPAGDKGAGWIHTLDNSVPLPPIKPGQDAKQTPKAAPDVLAKAYRALLAELTLSEIHRENLQRRGLTDAQIASLGYRTLPPNGRRELVTRLQAKSIRPEGVPGFYLEAGYWQLAGPASIAIPVRDTRGRIAGLQIRCDKAEGGRYKWLSSRGFNAGCSPGAPVHIAGTVSVNGEVWITEGPFKADIAALKLGRLVLAVPGVGNWPGVIPIVRELKPKRAIIAFDMDKASNPAVKLHSDALMACLIKRGIRTFEADWDIHFKGIDDLLTGGPDMSEITITEKTLSKSVTTPASQELPAIAWRGLFKAYRDMVAPTTEAADAFHYATFLQVFGCIIGRRLFVYHATRLYPNFYTCVVRRSGLTRKDTAAARGRVVLDMLHAYSEDDPSPPFKAVRGIRSYEGLLDELAGERKVRLIQLGELLSLLAKASQQSLGNIIPELTALYDCPDLVNPPVHQKDVKPAREPFLSIMAGTTQDWLQKALTERDIYGGFANRWLYFYGLPKEPMPNPPRVDQGKRKKLVQELNQIRSWAEDVPNGEITISDEANALFDEYYNLYYERCNLPGLIPTLIVRIQDFIWKISLLYAAETMSETISRDHLEAAISGMSGNSEHVMDQDIEAEKIISKGT